MTTRRWYLGGYEFKYSPSSYGKSARETSGISTAANGSVSSTNDFYDDSIDLVINIYDQPTHLGGSTILSFSSGLYSSIDQKNTTGHIFASKNTTVDIIDPITGTVTGSFSANLATTPSSPIVSLCHMSDRVGIFYSDGSLVICAENGAQISKYNYVDIDVLSINSITYDYAGSIYGLNKYGKVFRIYVDSGDCTVFRESSDFSYNKANNRAIYKSIHYNNGHIGFMWGTSLTFINSDTDIIYSTESPYVNTDISFSSYGKDYYILQPTRIVDYYPNTSGIDIERIKSLLGTGIVSLVDDKSTSINIIINSIEVSRKRNMGDARYEVSLSARIV